MTAVIFHDYPVSGLPVAPLAYLLGYFGHYQMLGLGHWPPAFHGALAIWMLASGVGKTQALIFVALVSATLATTAFAIVRSCLGVVMGAIAALLVLASPLIQAESAQVMVDVACALLCLLSALCFARYLRTAHWRDSVWFGAFAGVALLTKGNAALLALLPPIALLLTRRWSVLLQPSLWLAPITVLAIAAPFYLITAGWSAKGFLFALGWSYTSLALRENAVEMLRMYGAGILIFAAAGFVTRVLRPSEKQDPLWATLAALVLATLVFQAVVPVAIQARYLAPTVVPVVALAVAGAHDALHYAFGGRRSLMARPLLALLLLAGPMLPAAFAVQAQHCRSLEEVAIAIAKQLQHSNPVVLVGAHSVGEQAFATELAMRDPRRPSFVVAFGSRLFGGDGFMNDQYSERFKSDKEIEAVIQQLAIPYVVLDMSKESQAWGHNQRLTRIAVARGWTLLETLETADGAEVRIYRIDANVERPIARDALSAALSPRRRIPGT